jgi:adenylate kinase
MLRERIALGDSRGKRLAATLQAGGLVPDDSVNRMVEDRITHEDCKMGFMLDGYPRTVAQAQWLADRLALIRMRPMVVHLEVDYNVIVKRISGRRQCPVCGTLYNLASDPTRIACDLEGAKLEIRDDDREDVVRERLRAYDRQTAPVLSFFEKAGYAVWHLQGDGAPPEVIATRIQELIAGEFKERGVA